MRFIDLLRLGIRERIFLAFFIVTLLTFMTGLLGWISHQEASDSFEEVVNVNVVALGEMGELSKQTMLVTRSAQSIVRSESMEEQEQIWTEVSTSLTNISTLIQNLKINGHLLDTTGVVETELDGIKSILELINESSRSIKKLELKKTSFNKRMRWITSQTLDKIDAEINNLSLTIQSQLNTDLPAVGYAPLSVGSRDLGTSNKKLELLNELRAETNSLTMLMDRAQYLIDSDSLIATEIFANHRIRNIKKILMKLESYRLNQNFVYEISQVIGLISVDESIFKLRSKERSLEGVIVSHQESLNKKLDDVNAAIKKEAERTENQARYLVDQTRKQAVTNNLYLAIMLGFSILVSFLIGWKYVGKSIVGRILQLDKSMREVAAGDQQKPSPVGGNDEIGAMGKSLISFHEQLEQKQQELVQAAKLAALGQLSTGIAHEINQPLVAIRNYSLSSKMLIQQGELDLARQNIEEISLLTVRATQIVSSLKSLARKEEQSLSCIKIIDVVQEVLRIMQGAIKESGTSIKYDSANVMAIADKIRLEQVLLNLVSNAIDAVSDTDIKEIRIDSWVEDGWSFIEVCDSGKGISQEASEHIFEAFFTTKKSGKGLGLGLAISYNIIRNLDGDLYWHDSSLGGTSFFIKLPTG